MSAVLSAQMTQNLLALFDINDQVSTTQERLNTGKKINSVFDGAASYFKAKGLNDRAQSYEYVNSNIKLALSNITAASKAIDTMYSNLDGLNTQLKDAASKTIGNPEQMKMFGGASYVAAAMAGTAGSIIGGAATDGADSTLFQVGDSFAIQIYDQASGKNVTRHFRAVDATYTAPAGTISDGTNNAERAFTFRNVNELQAAINGAFGSDDLQMNIQDAGNGKVNIGLELKTTAPSTMQVTVAQTINSTTGYGVAGTPPTPNTTTAVAGYNATLDFSRLFGDKTQAGTTNKGQATFSSANGMTMLNAYYGNPTANPPVGPNLNATTAVVGNYGVYSNLGAAGGSDANKETRRQAADTYRATMAQLSAIAKDAYMPGYAALLMGATMQVDLNPDPGDVVQKVTIGTVDANGLGFGFDNKTGEGKYTANNFNNDTDITGALGIVKAAMATLRIRQNQLGAYANLMSTRMDYNTSFQTEMKSSASTITSADNGEEAASLAALQTRQNFATNNLTVTKNAEQSLLQLLR